MSGNSELGRGLCRCEKNATDEGARNFEKPVPYARAAPPEAHESFISRKTVAAVPLTGRSVSFAQVTIRHLAERRQGSGKGSAKSQRETMTRL